MRMPTSLKIVACLLLLTGAFACFKFVMAWQRSNIRLDINILCFFAGLGLLRRSRGWWKFAKLYTLLGMCIMPIGLLLIFSSPAPSFDASILTMPVGKMLREQAIILMLGMWLLDVWAYRVLTSQEVRHLFEEARF